MLRTIASVGKDFFGHHPEDTTGSTDSTDTTNSTILTRRILTMESASHITIAQFKDALERYPALIKTLSKERKNGALSLEQLDSFRYIEAPASFSKNTGRNMTLSDVQKLVDWKIHHGSFRPSLPKLVASNSNDKIEAATKDAFSYYAESPSDVEGVIKKLADPLKGIGAATASLLLAIHDPDHVIFFSDEAYRWLCSNGDKVTLKYNNKEFVELFNEARILMERLHVNPIEIEKVAFVLVKENEPVPEPKTPKVSSGRPRGRPPKSEGEKKVKERTGPVRGRGRPKGATSEAAEPKSSEATGAKKRGRPSKSGEEAVASLPKEVKRKAEDPQHPDTPVKKRGRPRKSVD